MKTEKTQNSKKSKSFLISLIVLLVLSMIFFACYSPTYARYLSLTSSSASFYFNNFTITNAHSSGTVIYTRDGDRNMMSQDSVMLCITNSSNHDYDIEVGTLLKVQNGITISEEKAIYLGVYRLNEITGVKVLCGVKKLTLCQYPWQAAFYYCGENSMAVDGGYTPSDPFVVTFNGNALIGEDEYQDIVVEYVQKNSDGSYSLYSYTDISDNMVLRTLKVYTERH